MAAPESPAKPVGRKSAGTDPRVHRRLPKSDQAALISKQLAALVLLRLLGLAAVLEHRAGVEGLAVVCAEASGGAVGGLADVARVDEQALLGTLHFQDHLG